jgi:hypothetical protein
LLSLFHDQRDDRGSGARCLLKLILNSIFPLFRQGADIVIVGRGILQAADQVAEAEQYRQRSFKALMERGSV